MANYDQRQAALVPTSYTPALKSSSSSSSQTPSKSSLKKKGAGKDVGPVPGSAAFALAAHSAAQLASQDRSLNPDEVVENEWTLVSRGGKHGQSLLPAGAVPTLLGYGAVTVGVARKGGKKRSSTVRDEEDGVGDQGIKKIVGDGFYRFTKEDGRRKDLENLKARFEEDKERVGRFRESRGRGGSSRGGSRGAGTMSTLHATHPTLPHTDTLRRPFRLPPEIMLQVAKRAFANDRERRAWSSSEFYPGEGVDRVRREEPINWRKENEEFVEGVYRASSPDPDGSEDEYTDEESEAEFTDGSEAAASSLSGEEGDLVEEEIETEWIGRSLKALSLVNHLQDLVVGIHGRDTERGITHNLGDEAGKRALLFSHPYLVDSTPRNDGDVGLRTTIELRAARQLLKRDFSHIEELSKSLWSLSIGSRVGIEGHDTSGYDLDPCRLQAATLPLKGPFPKLSILAIINIETQSKEDIEATHPLWEVPPELDGGGKDATLAFDLDDGGAPQVYNDGTPRLPQNDADTIFLLLSSFDASPLSTISLVGAHLSPVLAHPSFLPFLTLHLATLRHLIIDSGDDNPESTIQLEFDTFCRENGVKLWFTGSPPDERNP
ncbi:hypothetical protein RQP46_006197 [Phenoliferia psychrophenolica]